MNLSLSERALLMARQGHAFATADEVRVVYASETDHVGPLGDVPRDGKTMGEVVMRGNLVMKEVYLSLFCHFSRLLTSDYGFIVLSGSRGH
jgi:hypothetical protein